MTEVMKYTHAELEAEIRVIERDGEPVVRGEGRVRRAGFGPP